MVLRPRLRASARRDTCRVTRGGYVADYRPGGLPLAIDPQTWQGHFGEAVVAAMASAAGLVPTKRSLDVDGIDFNIFHPGRLGGLRHPAIDVQVKSWSSPRIIEGEYSYPLPRLNYDNLVGTVGIDFPVKRLLFLVIVPENCVDYMQVNMDSIAFFHSVYWTCIMDYDVLAADENTTSKTIRIPQSNRVDLDVLRSLLVQDFRDGGTA